MMKNVKAVDPDYNLWIMLEHARSAVVAAREKELGQYGVSMMKAAVLPDMTEVLARIDWKQNLGL